MPSETPNRLLVSILLGKRLEGFVERGVGGEKRENTLLRLMLPPTQDGAAITMASASFVLYVWIPSHEWLLVSTWPMNPGVPGRSLCRSPAIPTSTTGQNLIPVPIHFQSGHFHDTVQTYTVLSPFLRGSAPHYMPCRSDVPMSEGHRLNQCRALCGTPCPQGSQKQHMRCQVSQSYGCPPTLSSGKK